jgi:dihydrofolate reductase
MLTVGIAVMSLDGCLTRHGEEGAGFASREDQHFFAETLGTFDCMVMGGAGYRASRARARVTPAPFRVVLTREPEAYTAEAQAGVLEFRSDEPAETIRDLARRGFARCALVGGARLLTASVKAGLLDELWLTVEPVAFGSGLRLFEGRVEIPFELVGVESLGRHTLLIRYRTA